MKHSKTILLSLILPFLLPILQAAETGSLSGVVSNRATGELLQDATVEIPSLKQNLRTDELGRFVLYEVPLGSYEISVSYMTLKTLRQTVIISAENPNASLDFPLEDEVVQLDTFVVSGQREGTAAALTRQQTSDNLRDVLSMDAMGELPNENPGELLAQMAGISGMLDEYGDVNTVAIRGMSAARNTVTYDGAQMATSHGIENRSFRFLNINAATFTEIEVIKALTPDISASSQGGTVNMKTKSTLNMKDDLYFGAKLGLVYAPNWLTYSPRRHDRPWGPTASFDYRQVFSVGGGRRNLGVSLNLFYRKQLANAVRSKITYDHRVKEKTELPIVMVDYANIDNVTEKDILSATLRFDYKISNRHRFHLTTMYSEQRSWTRPGQENLRALVKGKNDADGIGTNSNSSYTVIAKGLQGEMQTHQGFAGFFDAQHFIQFGGKHDLQKVMIDYDLSYSESNVDMDGNRNDPTAGVQISRTVNKFGGTIDRRINTEFPTVITTTTPDYSLPDTGQGNLRLKRRFGERQGRVLEGKLNAKSILNIAKLPVQISSGLAYRREERKSEIRQEQYRLTAAFKAKNSDGSYPIASYTADLKFDERLYSLFNTASWYDMHALSKLMHDSTVFEQTREDFWSEVQQNKNNSGKLAEDISAVYLMGKTKIGKLNILAGFRIEHTRAEGKKWIIENKNVPWPTLPPGSTASERRAQAEEHGRLTYGDRMRVAKNDYTDIFPSLHFVYAFNRKLQARASFSTSIGRPPTQELLPGWTITESTQKISKNNPDLISEYTYNIDLAMEYYMSSAGQLSIGVFWKRINDFIYRSTTERLSPDDPIYDPNHNADWDVTMRLNGEEATVRGLEITYNQPLKFLPNPFKGTRIILSYTWLDMEATYMKGVTTNELPNFVPHSFNARLNYAYKRFSLSVAAAYTDSYMTEYNSGEKTLVGHAYKDKRFALNASTSWRFSNHLTATLSVNNILNEPQVWYRGVKERRQETVYNGQFVSLVLSSRF